MQEIDRTQFTILLIEDAHAFAELILRDLKKSGYNVLWASSGSAAKRLLAQVHAVLLDLNLPDVHGHDALAEIVATYPHLPVIVLSGDDSIDAYRSSLARGAIMHFSKDSVRQRLDELLAHLDAQALRRADPFQVDYNAELVRYRGQVVPLSPREFRLAAYFIERPDQLITEEQLREEAFGAKVEGESVVRTAISRLRNSVKEGTGMDFPLDTVKRQGYYYKRSTSGE